MRSVQRFVREKSISSASSASTSRRVEREDVRVALGRVVDETELLVVDLRRAHPVRARELRVGEAFGDLVVELGELLPGRRELGDVLDLCARLDVRGLLAKRRGERLEGTRVVVEHLARDARDLAEQLDAPIGLALGLAEDVERGEQLRPVAALLVDVLEDARRLGAQVLVGEERLEGLACTGVLRVQEEDLAVVLERAAGVAGVLLERLSEPVFQVDQLCFGGIELDATAQRVDVRLPALELPVEYIQRGERADVGRLVLEHAVVGVDGAIEVLQLGLVELRDLVADLLLLAVVGRELAALLVDPEEIREALRRAIEALERGERVGVLAVGVVDGAIDGERLVDLVHFLDEDATELETQRDGERCIARVGGLVDRLAIGALDLAPLACCFGGALGVDRGLLVGGEEEERGQVARERLCRVLDLALVERGDLTKERELGVRVLFVTELDLDRVGERLRVAGL